jgi:hypothetical protein
MRGSEVFNAQRESIDCADLELSEQFIFSEEGDIFAFVLPICLAILSLPALWWLDKDDGVPLWAFVALVVAVDVAHVWTTMFRTYLDYDELQRRWRLYTCVPCTVLVCSTLVHYHSATRYWTAVAYLAIYHFISQDYGLISLYNRKRGVRNHFEYRVDKWTLTAGCIGPVLLWHASPTKRFDWFQNGETFLVTVPPVLVPLIYVVYACSAALYLLVAFRNWHIFGIVHSGKYDIMAATWLTWFVGSLVDNELVSLAFVNLFHGVPFFFLVHKACVYRWANRKAVRWGERLVKYIVRPTNVHLFYLLPFALALLEELLWDIFVWQHYIPDYLPLLFPGSKTTHLPQLSPMAMSLAVSLLALPQVTHYVLDGFIWRLDGSNPQLADALCGASPDFKDLSGE